MTIFRRPYHYYTPTFLIAAAKKKGWGGGGLGKSRNNRTHLVGDLLKDEKQNDDSHNSNSSRQGHDGQS